MSADNWRACPFCKKSASNAREKAIEDAEKLYGKVPASKYREALEVAKEMPEDDEVETLREDYELGILADGSFYISYTGSCEECRFEYNFKQNVSPKDVLKGQKLNA